MSHGLRLNPGTWGEHSWKPALVAAGILRQVGNAAESYGSRVRLHPVHERSRPDMFHVLRHTFVSVQLEAGESLVSVATSLGRSSPRVTLDYYVHFMPGIGTRGLAGWLAGWLAAMDTWLV
ncbi:hypothetical protein [Streptomyces sp. NPDC102282]|uniref:hypothetical protein n=1 Tax=Streptomyces sp. NPDC102282 TaxID=3366154 RepID=UPI0038283900